MYVHIILFYLHPHSYMFSSFLYSVFFFFFFSSRRRHTRCLSDWSSDVCSSDLVLPLLRRLLPHLSRDHRLLFIVSRMALVEAAAFRFSWLADRQIESAVLARDRKSVV